MITLRDKYEKEKQQAIEDAKQIRMAMNYNHPCLLLCAASESRAKERMKWVKEAEAKFIEDNKKAIFELAAQMCEEYAGVGEDK